MIPKGDYNAELLRKSSIWQNHAMRSLRWQVGLVPLLVANPTLFQEVRRSLKSSPGKRPHLGGLASNRLQPAAREPRESPMTFQISRRGKEYLETAQTLLRAAQNMTDRAVAGQLKAL